MKRIYIVVAALVSASPALAGSYGVAPTVSVVHTEVRTVQAFSWSGAYAGLFAGTARGTYTLGVSALDQLGPDVRVRGTVGGGFIGYNWQRDNSVFGVEFDASTGPSGITPQGTLGPVWICGTGDCNVDIRSVMTLRGRAGYAIDRMHVYGTAGIAHARVRGGIEGSVQQGGGSATGWVAGVGAEWATSRNLVLRTEYLHHNFGALPFGTNGGTETFDGVGSYGVLRLGAAFRF